jgi:hypothetical protein
MPRPTVEQSGPAWHCGSLQLRCPFAPRRASGTVRVGDQTLRWELTAAPFGVLVQSADGR